MTQKALKHPRPGIGTDPDTVRTHMPKFRYMTVVNFRPALIHRLPPTG